MGLSATWTPSRPAPAAGKINRRFAELFSATCAHSGGRTAIVDGDTRLTFADWERRSDSLAAAMAERGVRRGDTVAFQLPNWWETAVVFTAIARLGAIANPLLPMFRERELLFMLRQSGAKHLFVPERYRDTDYLDLIARVRDLGAPVEHVYTVRGRDLDDFTQMVNAGSQPPAIAGRPDDLLLLMYTSGTTADPKGVLHTNQTLVAEVESLERVHRLTSDDSTLMPSPLTHISGVLHGIMTPALLATAAVLMERWDAASATRLIAREGVTYMVGAPIFLQDLISARGDGRWAQSLRLFSCGGASVPAALMRAARRELGCVAKRVYGSTEFPTMTTTGPDDSESSAIETEGKPIPPNEIRIVDSHGDPLPAGAQGEIQARGPECFVGYVDPEMNRDCFTADGWFRTGDLGVLGEDGYLTVTGRIKEIVIRKGEKISIREIEELLLAHPAVHQAAVVGIADPQVGERLCAALALEPGSQLSSAEILDFLRAQGLASQKLPERIAFTPQAAAYRQRQGTPRRGGRALREIEEAEERLTPSGLFQNYSATRSSTRRFCARPSLVSFDATGRSSPKPLVCNRPASMPLSFRYLLTDAARRRERPRL